MFKEQAENLQQAIEVGDIDQVRNILNTYPDLKNTNIENKVFVLHTAATKGQYQIYKCLVEEYKIEDRKNNFDTFYYTPIMYSAEYGQLEFIKNYKIDYPKVNLAGIMHKLTKYQLTHIAAANGHFKTFNYLVTECGCNLYNEDHEGFTPLSRAIWEGKLEFLKQYANNHAYNLKTYIESVENYYEYGDLGLTSIAVQNGRYNIFKYLTETLCLDSEAIAIPNNKYLMIAAKNRQVQFILKCKEDHPDLDLKSVIREKDGAQLIHIAAENGDYKSYKLLIQKYSFDKNALTAKNYTPLMMSTKCKNFEFLKAFKADNPEIDLREISGPYGYKLTHLAIKFDSPLILKWLIQENSFDINYVNQFGKTLLNFAIRELKDTCVKELIILGINLDQVNFKKQMLNSSETIMQDVHEYMRFLKKGLLADAIYYNNPSFLKNYALTTHNDFSIIDQRLYTLYKLYGFRAEARLNLHYFPPKTQKLLICVIEKFENLLTSKDSIIEKIEVHTADLCNELDVVKFPCKRPYRSIEQKLSEERPEILALLYKEITENNIKEQAPYQKTINNILQKTKIKTINKDEMNSIVSLLSYKLEPHYQPYEFFLYMIKPENKENILEILIKHSSQANYIFKALKDIYLNSEDLTNFRNLQKMYEDNPLKNVFIKILTEHQNIIKSHEALINKYELELNKSFAQRDEELEKRELLKQPQSNKITGYFTSKLKRKTTSEPNENLNPKGNKLTKAEDSSLAL